MSSEEQLVSSIEHHQKALLINPHSSFIYRRLAELYCHQGDLEQALEICCQALVIQPNSASILDTLDEIFIRLGFSDGEAKWLAEVLPKMRIEEAIADLVFQHHEISNHGARTWKVYIISGYALAQRKSWDDALEYCFNAIKLEPSLNFPHFIIQYFILPEIDDVQSLVNRYIEVIQLPRINYLAYSVLGDLLTKQKRLSEATQAYKRSWLPTKCQGFTREHLDPQRTSIDYLVIGVGKAGTTSFFNYLSQHPKIFHPRKKEIRFFNEHYDCGLDWYLAQFPPASFSQGEFLTGEATPWYLGTIGAEDRVFQAFPDIKLIAILRNPVSRTISNYYMNQKLGLEQRTLKEAIASEISILGDVDLTEPQAIEKVSTTYWKTEQGYLWFSLYLPFLKRWMALFKKEQFLILNSQHLYDLSSETMSKVFSFLGVSNCSLINYSKSNMGSYPINNHDVKNTLFDFFSQHNRALEEYLGIEFGWSDQL